MSEWILILVVIMAFAALGRPLFALSANVHRGRCIDEGSRKYDVAAGVHCWKGGLAGLHPVSKYLKPLEGGDIFAGLFYEECDNSSGAAGDKKCRVEFGDFVLPLSGVAIADIGKPVFGIDDATLSLVGHPNSFVGRIVGVEESGLAAVRQRHFCAPLSKGEGGCLEFNYRADGVYPTGLVAGNGPAGDFQVRSILGLGATLDPAVGGCSLAFDAVAEVAQVSIETPVCLSITKGIIAEFDLNAESIGDNAALDIDFGLFNVLDATTRANMDDATLTRKAAFHMDGNSANILFGSDDDTTDVAEVDTTVDNDTTAGATKECVVVMRPSGIVECWVAGVRRLAATVFSVGAAAGLFGAACNAEKTNDDTTAEIVLKRARITGARA